MNPSTAVLLRLQGSLCAAKACMLRKCFGSRLTGTNGQVHIALHDPLNPDAAGRFRRVFPNPVQVDSVVMMRLFAPAGVAKASLASWPLVGTCISAFQVRFFDPATGSSPSKALKKSRPALPAGA